MSSLYTNITHKTTTFSTKLSTAGSTTTTADTSIIIIPSILPEKSSLWKRECKKKPNRSINFSTQRSRCQTAKIKTLLPDARTQRNSRAFRCRDIGLCGGPRKVMCGDQRRAYKAPVFPVLRWDSRGIIDHPTVYGLFIDKFCDPRVLLWSCLVFIFGRCKTNKKQRSWLFLFSYLGCIKSCQKLLTFFSSNWKKLVWCFDVNFFRLF